jgi:hypothetical protein
MKCECCCGGKTITSHTYGGYEEEVTCPKCQGSGEQEDEMKVERNIVGAFVLGCTELGKEGLADMGCQSIEQAVRLAWKLMLPRWAISGMVDGELKTICEGQCV